MTSAAAMLFRDVGLLVHCMWWGSREVLRTYLKSN